MGKFYNRLLLIQITLLLLLFGVPKLFATESQGKPELSKKLNKELSQALKAYQVKYDVIAKGDKVGSASRQLEQLSNGQWQIAMQSKVKYYFFSDKRQETSRFEVINEQILPLQYQRQADSSFKDSNLLQQFDWSKEQETGSFKDKKWSIALPNGALDQLTQLLAVRQQLMTQKPLKPITISYRGGIRNHNFKVIGEETLKLPMGEIKTAKIQLDEKSRKRQTNFWLALDNNMLPVQIQRIKKGKEEARLVAKSW